MVLSRVGHDPEKHALGLDPIGRYRFSEKIMRKQLEPAMSVLEMDLAKFPAAAKTLYEDIAARRRAKGEGFGGPYLALLNHPALAERVEAVGFYLKFEGVLPRVHYQFIVLSVAHATGAAFEWQDHVRHARAAGLPQDIIDGIAGGAEASLPHPFALLREVLTKTLAWQPIPDALQAQAAAEWGNAGLVEIVVVSGFYQMFAAINQGFDILGAKA
jgi:4-carboxymuconolactone decarboxylase